MGVFEKIYSENVQRKYEEIRSNVKSDFFTLWFSYFNAVINTFTWKNLPEGVLPQMPEEFLCYWGQLAMFNDDEGNVKIYPTYGSGEYLENGLYSEYTIIARNGRTWIRDINDIELCFNNAIKYPSIWFINEMTDKSTSALRAVDAALERAILPPIIECQSEEQEALVSKMYDREKNLMPFRTVLGKHFSGENSVQIHQIFDNRVNDVLALWDVYVRYRNFFYTFIGINNVEIQKRERLTEAEGSGNDEITRFTLINEMNEMRQDFVTRANKKFGTNLDIQINRDISTVYALSADNSEKIEAMDLTFSKGANITKQEGDENESVSDKK